MSTEGTWTSRNYSSRAALLRIALIFKFRLIRWCLPRRFDLQTFVTTPSTHYTKQEELGEGGAPVSPKQERGSGGDDQDDDLNPELTEDDEGLIDNGERSFVSLKKGKVGLEDFKLLKLIGKGGFGKVSK